MFMIIIIRYLFRVLVSRLTKVYIRTHIKTCAICHCRINKRRQCHQGTNICTVCVSNINNNKYSFNIHTENENQDDSDYSDESSCISYSSDSDTEANNPADMNLWDSYYDENIFDDEQDDREAEIKKNDELYFKNLQWDNGCRSGANDDCHDEKKEETNNEDCVSWEKFSKGVSTNIMKRFGYEGKGLGKNGSGILTPVSIKKKDKFNDDAHRSSRIPVMVNHKFWIRAEHITDNEKARRKIEGKIRGTSNSLGIPR